MLDTFITRFIFLLSCDSDPMNSLLLSSGYPIWQTLISIAKELIPMFHMIVKSLIIKHIVCISFPGRDKHLQQSTRIMEGRRQIWSSFDCWWSEYPEWIFYSSLMRHSSQRKFEIFELLREIHTWFCLFSHFQELLYHFSKCENAPCLSPTTLFWLCMLLSAY